MKNILIYITILALAITSCKQDIFDQKPLDKISELDVWNNEAMINSVLTGLYSQLPNTRFIDGANQKNHSWSDENTTCYSNSNDITEGRLDRTSKPSGTYWNYEYIREVNTFLEKTAEAPINDEAKKQMIGECRVIRAWTYFQMQKRYGGVPLVDVVLDPTEEVDQKYSMRSTEEDLADWLDAELSEAAQMLSEEPAPQARINKWVALAMKARINLWSASIAKYGELAENKYTGLPETRANDFYQKASDAVDAVLESGKYELYEKNLADKSENYRNLFVDDNDNGEVIWQRVYNGVDAIHGYDGYCAPHAYASGQGNALNPTLEAILQFENIDGTTDQPEFGIDNLYPTAFAAFANKDPRLHASVFFNGDKYAGDNIVYTYEGIDTGETPNESNIQSGAGEYNDKPNFGNCSRFCSNQFSTRTGFILKKHLSNSQAVPSLSSTNHKIIRLGEMFLIKAEAQFELGNLDVAAEALNKTRKRAGIKLLDENTITRKHVRTERFAELFVEDHRYWDLRRWRIAEEVLNGAHFSGLRIIYHDASDQYYFLPLPQAGSTSRVFTAKHYYNPITNKSIANNKDLVENPYY